MIREADMGQTQDPPRVTYLMLVAQLLRFRRPILFLGLCTAIVLVGLALLRPRTYTVVSAFIPQSRRSPAALSGLAAQFGLTLPGTETSLSPQFFESLLRTRELLDAVVTGSYRLPTNSEQAQGSLLDFYRIKGGDSAVRLARAEARLQGQFTTTLYPKTGVVVLQVTTTSGEMAAQINRRFLDLLDKFNLESRQSQATAERRFTERRLGEVRAELREAEDRLQGFLQSNRGFRSSSELAFHEDRLRREVALRQQVYTTLSQAFEQARIEEVRDTPVITVVEQPKLPLLPDRRRLVAKAVLGGFLGVLLAASVSIVALAAKGAATMDMRTAGDLAALRTETLADLRRPWRFLQLRVRRD